MPRQQVEFEFPDPDKEEDTTEFEVDDAENREFIFEKDKEAHESKKKGK